jgi:hypothetical protein
MAVRQDEAAEDQATPEIRVGPSSRVGYFRGMTLEIALAAAPRGNDLPLVAVAAMMALAAFFSVRNMALAAMAMSRPLARHFAILHARDAAPLTPSWHPASHFAMLALACVMAFGGGLFSGRLAPDRAYPAAALAFMNQRGLHGNVLGEFGWREYLLWHAAPQDKVFIDGLRHRLSIQGHR